MLKQKAAILYTNKVSIEAARIKVAGVEKTSTKKFRNSNLKI